MFAYESYACFEANIEIYFSNIGDKTTNIYDQNPECNGSYVVYELEGVLQRGYFFTSRL